MMTVPGTSWLGNVTICRRRRARSCRFSFSWASVDCNLGEYARETRGGAICICGGCSKLKVSCARVVVQDNNAIAAAQQIGRLILDISFNAFSKFLLKMIKDLRAADSVKPRHREKNSQLLK